MRKKPINNKIMFPVTMVYIGAALIFLTILFNEYSTLLSALGQSLLTLGFVIFLFDKQNKRIDDTVANHAQMKNIGIDKIISSEKGYETLEELIKTSYKVDIVLNVDRLSDRFCYFLIFLIEDCHLINFNILVASAKFKSMEYVTTNLDEFTSSEEESINPYKLEHIKNLFIKAHKNKNIQIRGIKRQNVETFLLTDNIVDNKVCYMHSNFNDNKPFMFIIFNEHGDGYRN